MSGFAIYLFGALTVFTLFTAVWGVSVFRRDASLVDRFWGIGFAAAGLGWWLAAGQPAAAWWMLLPVLAWGVRLSVYIAWRNWGHGEDSRYADMRAGRSDATFALRSLPMIFWLQALLVAIIGLPIFGVVIAAPPESGALQLVLALGVLVWAFGFVFEAVADAQMAGFKADPAQRGKVMDRGLWRYSRHPNYFGEMTLWVGFGLIATAFGAWWGWFSVVLMIVLLARVSGVTLLEKKLTSTRPGYREYVERTSTLIPRPPRKSS